MRYIYAICGSTAAVALALQTSQAVAQDAGPPASAQSDGGIEEIVVTAQRRNESMQDVPIAVSALSADQMKSRGITDAMNLQANIPSLSVVSTSQSANLYIRGVGQNGGGPNNENSVAMYIDEIYMAAPQMNLIEFNNVEQIEVLKGPQGTLFGRNATGGVILIRTREPKQEARFDGSFGVGNYGTWLASGYATAGLGDNLAGDIAVYYRARTDGWGRSLSSGKKINEREFFSVRSKLLFTPGENTKIRLAGDFNRQRSDGINYRPEPTNPNFALVPADAGPYDTITNLANKMDYDNSGGSLKIVQELGDVNLTSISAYRHLDSTYVLDNDGLPTTINHAFITQGASYFTQELQLGSDRSDAPLNWLIGGFYFNSDASYSPFRIVGTAVPPVGVGYRDTYGHQKTISYAAYGQSTVKLGSRTNLTLGLRYTHEQQTLDGRIFVSTTGVTTTPPKQQQTFNNLSFRIALDHKFSDDIMGYVSMNRGQKSGGFGLSALTQPGYLPEQLDAYEIGLKTTLFDRKLRFNAAAFYYDYSDLQVQSFVNGVNTVYNAARARMYGLDIDLQARLTDQWTITAALGLVSGKYTSFPNAVVYSIDGTRVGPATGLDVSGNDTINTPPVSGSFSSEYTIGSSVGEFVLSGTVTYFGGAWGNPNNIARLPPYTMVNASAFWRSNSERVDVRLWVNNLNNAKYRVYSQTTNLVGYMVKQGDPRTFGMTLGLHF